MVAGRVPEKLVHLFAEGLVGRVPELLESASGC